MREVSKKRQSHGGLANAAGTGDELGGAGTKAIEWEVELSGIPLSLHSSVWIGLKALVHYHSVRWLVESNFDALLSKKYV